MKKQEKQSNNVWEDEDEKIRKWLFDFVQGLPDEGLDFKFYNLNKEQVIAWLEKQGQKPTWSEEDDSMFQSCIGAVATNDYYKGEEKEQIYDWLKSLKQRIGGSYDR